LVPTTSFSDVGNSPPAARIDTTLAAHGVADDARGIVTRRTISSISSSDISDLLLPQSAMDLLQSAADELVVEGESFRQRQKPQLAKTNRADRLGLTGRPL